MRNIFALHESVTLIAFGSQFDIVIVTSDHSLLVGQAVEYLLLVACSFVSYDV